jgi:hypothetical protein
VAVKTWKGGEKQYEEYIRELGRTGSLGGFRGFSAG